MENYKQLILPQSMMNSTKNEIFTTFLNFNIFVWSSQALYSKNVFNSLKSVIDINDDNRTTWWKLWFKTISMVAENSRLSYMEYTCDKIMENTQQYTDEELATCILDLDALLINVCNITIFSSVEAVMKIYKDESIKEGTLKLFDKRNNIHDVIAKIIPVEAINKTVIKSMLGKDIVQNFDGIDYANIIKEFLYRESIQTGKLTKQNVSSVLNTLLSKKYMKDHPELTEDVWEGIKAIFNGGDKKDE